MSFLCEVYYRSPVDPGREREVTEIVEGLGGSLDYREADAGFGSGSVCLTYEFGEWDSARAAADSLRSRGAHVEGPATYGA